MSRSFALPHRAPAVFEPCDSLIAQFCAHPMVRFQGRRRRDFSRALTLPLPPAPSVARAQALVLESLLSRVGPAGAESFDADLELERTLGLPSERRRALDALGGEDPGLLLDLRDLGVASCTDALDEPLVLVTHNRWRSHAWQNRALRVLSPAVRDAGLSAALIAAPVRWLWKLEQCLPVGRLALLHPIGRKATARDVPAVLSAADGDSPSGPWRAAAHVGGQAVAWAPAGQDALLMPPHTALGLDAMRSRAERAFAEVLAAALPALRGVHRRDGAAERWVDVIAAVERLLVSAELLSSELRAPEGRARERVLRSGLRAIESDRVRDRRLHSAAIGDLLAVMLERRRLAHHRLMLPVRAAAGIAALAGVAQAEGSCGEGYDDRSVTIRTHASPDRALRLPLDPRRPPVLVHADGTPAPIELDAATVPYLEAIVTCPERAAQIVLGLVDTPAHAVRPSVRRPHVRAGHAPSPA